MLQRLRAARPVHLPNRRVAKAFGATVFATTVRHVGLGELVKTSDTIVLGRVEATRAFWQGKQIDTEV